MYSLVLMMALSGSADAPANHGCHGCSGCHGCYSSCHGCHGCHGGHKKHGCHGCHGCNSCYGCYGSCTGYSCCGGYACYGSGCMGCYGGAPVVAPPPPPPAKKDDVPAKKKEEEASKAAPATIVVSLPANAKLLIDDRATTSTSAVRTFATPALEQGKEFSYTLTAEIVREGKTETVTEKVTVRAGEASRVNISFPAPTGVASK
ncbi:MAG: TIGR03000 domain-containing protein [Gemmataceae bacterium]|nr:TIGR03000 domain-containing protein [Gemmataceae bacterium]